MEELKPKKPRSAYIFFSKETVKRLLEENPDMPMTECAKKAGTMWAEYSEDDKARFFKMQMEDVEREV